MTSRLPNQRRHPADGTAATSRLLVPTALATLAGGQSVSPPEH
jgi:hypothetical protein